MKSRLLLLLPLVLPQTVWGKNPAKSKDTINVAVTNLKPEEGVSASQASLMSDILRTELYKTGRFTVMNREDMDAILKEIKFQQSGACDQTSCIVEMGQALGVDRMIAGTVGLLGDSYVINAKLINIATQKNEVLVTEYQDKKDPAGPQGTFRRVALKLAGFQASIEAPTQGEVQTSRKSLYPLRGVYLMAEADKSGQNLKGDVFHSQYAGDGYQAYNSNGFALSFYAGYQIHKYVCLQAGLSLYSGDVRIKSDGTNLDGTLVARMSRTSILGGVRISPMTGRYRPFVGLNVGQSSVHYELLSAATENFRPFNQPVFALSGGLEAYLTRHLGAFVQITGFAANVSGTTLMGGGLSYHI